MPVGSWSSPRTRTEGRHKAIDLGDGGEIEGERPIVMYTSQSVSQSKVRPVLQKHSAV